MIGKIIDKVIGPLFGTLSAYYNLPAYVKTKWVEKKHGKHSYFREEDFWKDAIGQAFQKQAEQKLRDGNVIELQGFELSEWFPRAPGSFWTAHGSKLRTTARGEIEHETPDILVFTPKGKELMIQGGVGTLRLELHGTGAVKYKVLGATSSGDCSRGIPVVLPEDVYLHLRDDLLTEGCLRATVKGVYTRLPISPEDIVMNAAGVKVPPELGDWLGRSFFVPRNCVLVESVLNLEKLGRSSDLRADAWSLYHSEESSYGWTYHSFDPRDESSLANAIHFLNEYAWSHGGSAAKFVTEFDEGTPRLNAEWEIPKIFSQAVNPRPRAESLLAWGAHVSV